MEVSLRRLVLALVVAGGIAGPAGAQGDPGRPGRPGTVSTAADSAVERRSPPGSLWRTGLRGAGGVAIATVAAFPLDVPAARSFRGAGPQGSSALHDGAAVFNAVGQPGVLVASVAMYGVGRLTDRPRLTSIGAHATEAIVISGTVTFLVKVAAGRQRPYVDREDADDFSLGGGRREGRTSFPSGHATAAFAFASAVTTDLHHWRPDVARVAGPLLYAGAAAVGAARMYDDRHWASDVVLGAGIGTLVGRLVTLNARADPDNWLDRQLRAVVIAPSERGLVVGAHHRFR